MNENMPLHQWMARDAYWGAPDAHAVVPPAGRLAIAESVALAAVAGGRDIAVAFRQMCGPAGFEGRCLPLPAGEPLPVLGERDPGVLQLVYDRRITYLDAAGGAARRRAARSNEPEDFDMRAAAMEQPGSLQLEAATAVAPGVVVMRSVRYARGARLPFDGFGRYADLRHVTVPVGDLASMLDPMRRSRLRPGVEGDLVSRRTVSTTDRKGAVILSRIAVAYHLKPGQEPSGGHPWWSLNGFAGHIEPNTA